MTAKRSWVDAIFGLGLQVSEIQTLDLRFSPPEPVERLLCLHCGCSNDDQQFLTEDECMRCATGPRSCATCTFADKEMNFQEHYCLRRAPVMVQVPRAEDLRAFVPRWPIVRSENWCGEYERKVDKNNNGGERGEVKRSAA